MAWNKKQKKIFRRSLVISGLFQACLCILTGGFIMVSDAMMKASTGQSIYVQIVKFIEQLLKIG